MTSNPNDYKDRAGVLPISWEDFHGLCKALVVGVAPFQPEIILPVGRGGYYAGTLIAHMLQVEVYPVRLSRRVRDVVTYESPRWIMEPPEGVRGRRVLIVDEISSSGETLTIVKQKAIEMGAREARCAVLYAHSWGTAVPDYIGLVSDALILNPWDREIWAECAFQPHPEYVAGLRQQGLDAGRDFFIPAGTPKLAKG